MEYSTLKSERIFEGKVFNVRIDEVQKSGGEPMRVDIVEHAGAVVIIPKDENDSILLVEQYRHPTGKVMIELPAGTMDENESPETAAVRECREEVGMAPSRIDHLGGFYLAPGYSTEYLHVFLATELSPAPLPHDSDEDIAIERFSIEEIVKKISVGEIEDAKTMAGVFLLMQHLEES